MTVYELMQELSRYKADTEVKFCLKANFEAEFGEEDETDMTVAGNFCETLYFDDIEDNESVRYGNSYIQINLEY